MNEAGEQRQHLVVSVFRSHETAHSAIERLRALGFDDEDFGLAIHDPNQYEFVGDKARAMVKDMVRGAAIGVPVGSLAGIALLGVLIPTVGVMGVGGVLASVLVGAKWGAVLGTLGGLYARFPGHEEDNWGEIRLHNGGIIVAVRAGTRIEVVCATLSELGAQCTVETAVPASHRRLTLTH